MRICGIVRGHYNNYYDKRRLLFSKLGSQTSNHIDRTFTQNLKVFMKQNFLSNFFMITLGRTLKITV